MLKKYNFLKPKARPSLCPWEDTRSDGKAVGIEPLTRLVSIGNIISSYMYCQSLFYPFPTNLFPLFWGKPLEAI